MNAKKIYEDFKSSNVFYSLMGLIGLIILASIIAPNFRSLNNFITILRQASVLLVLSSGLTVVLLTGGMDLSVGATAGFVGCICAQCLKSGMPVLVCMLIGLLVGAVVGCVNGLLAGILPSFIATYGTNWVMSGLAVLVMQGAIIYDLPEGFTNISVGYHGMIPNLVIIATIVVILFWVLLSKTTYGRRIYAYGSNPTAAVYAGIPARKFMVSAFVLCSVCAGFAGMLMCARLNAADAAMGDSYGLQTVAAVVVGGTSMLGGEGGILGTVIGAMILTIIINVMNLIGVSSYAQGFVIGIVIIAMVLFDTFNKKKQARKVA
ncbi:MAG: ABC transporter permease [Clostridiales bacterium]|nr:ABC transporter permease [Clostridiales bacterium]